MAPDFSETARFPAWGKSSGVVEFRRILDPRILNPES
jgi:hypothetical protein